MDVTESFLTLEYILKAKKVRTEGSVRIDLLGGTIDLVPLNFILRDTVTLNIATSLKAKVEIEETKSNLKIVSIDYGNSFTYEEKEFKTKNFISDHFGPMSFVCQILDHFSVTKNITLTLSSGSPPGAGLGGSSSMGVTLYKCLCEYTDRPFNRMEAINVVQAIESKILNKGPCGYQDYYPALYGGVLALVPRNEGVQVEQFHSEALSQELEQRLTLVYSGALRLSAINNWEVYKSFFDGDTLVTKGLKSIAKLARQAYEALNKENYDQFFDLICREGETREGLFTNIVTTEMKDIRDDLLEKNLIDGMKVCGAGGGGCFILVHSAKNRDIIRKEVQDSGLQILDFKVDKPL